MSGERSVRVGGGWIQAPWRAARGSIRVLDPVVDTAGDQPDAAPGDGVCATAGGGCTLGPRRRRSTHSTRGCRPSSTSSRSRGNPSTLSIPGTNGSRCHGRRRRPRPSGDRGRGGGARRRRPGPSAGLPAGPVGRAAGTDRHRRVCGGLGPRRRGRGRPRRGPATAVEVEDVAFHANTAETGGGGLSGFRVAVTNSTFTDNAGGLYGGGLMGDASTLPLRSR